MSVDGDVDVIVEGKTLKFQKSILMAKSEYFRAMFDSNMIECRTNTVTLNDVKLSIASWILEFMRSGELKIGRDSRDLNELTQAAVMLQVPEAIESCSTLLKDSLSDENCLSLLSFAKSLSLESLFSFAKRHALYHFLRVRRQTEFCELALAELSEYLSHPHLNCESEIDILDAVLIWYKNNKAERELLLPELTKCFHAEDVLENCWEAIMGHELANQSTEWQVFLEKECQRIAKLETPKKKFRRVPCMLLNIGGFVTDMDGRLEPCKDICKFDTETETFVPFQKLTDIYPALGSKMGYQVTVIGKDIYLSGGQVSMTQYSMLTDVWKFDSFEQRWSKVTKLLSPRRHHGACGSEHSLYVLGGFGKYRDILDSVEQYNTVKDQWISLPKMPCAWFTPHAVYCPGKLYVYKTHLISLDLGTLEWTTIREIPFSDDHMNTCIPYYFNGFIYEFPFRDQEFESFYDIQVGKLQMIKTCLKTGSFNKILYNEQINFGNRTFIFGWHFFTIDRNNNELICGDITDFQHYEKLGSFGKTAGLYGFLVAVPDYPCYRIKPSVCDNK